MKIADYITIICCLSLSLVLVATCGAALFGLFDDHVDNAELFKMMARRWNITGIVLVTFMLIVAGITGAVYMQTPIDGEWKELLLLMLGAFIGSYGKIIDYWFSDTDKDKMLVQKMDEEDGQSFSNTLGG